MNQPLPRLAGRSTPTGERKTVKGRYLVGADGANSFVRKHLQMPWEDLGFNERWVVLDFKQKRPLHFEFDNGQICDPKRPMCLFQLGKTHRRFEYMVMPGESRDLLAHLSVQRLQPLPIALGGPNVGAGKVVDLDGTYRDYFQNNAVRAVLVRPDFHIYGGAKGPEDLDAMIARLGVALQKCQD